ncbi:MAG: hypothetical protein IT193_15350 [Propionibacteriaceae bacterium]|nr:hypothetical protein [Propionibacteriaceae bacterium]
MAALTPAAVRGVDLALEAGLSGDAATSIIKAVDNADDPSTEKSKRDTAVSIAAANLREMFTAALVASSMLLTPVYGTHVERGSCRKDWLG